jgi:transcriptional regulator with XRE-family HTH domain
MPERQIHRCDYRQLIASLKAARKSVGLSQAQVAARLGVSRTWVSKIESCELNLTIVGFVTLCRLYGLRAAAVIRKLEA